MTIAHGTVKATILFATYNGADTLPRMLDALTKTTLPHDLWKIVAVDNNSKDDTAAILRSYQDRLPLEVHFEPKQGKENALATGFRHLEGDLVILTDDDVIPEPDWVERYLELAASQPGFSLFGGLIQPHWEQEPEDWVQRYAHMGVLYAVNEELPEGPISAHLISGPNSAFRRSVIGDSYVVHDNLGPNASVKQYPMGQDAAFALRLERNGGRAYHCRSARVRHIIKKSYVTESWILGRAERYGRGIVLIRPDRFARKAMIAGVPAGALLTWLSMAPLAWALGHLPRTRRTFNLRWNQRLRQGIVRQFAAASRR